MCKKLYCTVEMTPLRKGAKDRCFTKEGYTDGK